jgi:type IV secretion system protein VirB4
MSGEVKGELDRALTLFRDTTEPHQRSMSLFMRTVQDFWLKGVIQPFTHGHVYGPVFDGIDGRAWEEPVLTFELFDCRQDKLLTAALSMFVVHLVRRGARDDAPTLFLMDEVHNNLVPPWLEPVEKLQREGRKENIQLGLISQNIFDFAGSHMSKVFMGNCQSRIYTPDRDLAEEGTAETLEQYGLRRSEITKLSEALPRRQFGFHRKNEADGEGSGFVVLDLELGPIGRALCATTGRGDQALADRVLSRHGRADFLRGWMLAKGLPAAAAALDADGGEGVLREAAGTVLAAE